MPAPNVPARSKPKRPPIWIIAACLALTACIGSNGVGDLRIEALSAHVTQPCPHPDTIAQNAPADWEIIAGRLGDELITCESKRAVAAEGHEKVRAVLSGAQQTTRP